MSALAFRRAKMGDTCFLLVPKIEQQDAAAGLIKGGSAIVTAGGSGGQWFVYYEGNLFGASNLCDFKERAQVVIPPISTDARSRTITQPWPSAALG